MYSFYVTPKNEDFVMGNVERSHFGVSLVSNYSNASLPTNNSTRPDLSAFGILTEGSATLESTAVLGRGSVRIPMMAHLLVWDIETVPDLQGFAAAHGHDGKDDDEIRDLTSLKNASSPS